MANRIETLVSAERRLLLDISHELRSPLARLGVAIELARSGDDLNKALNRIQKESDRLNALVGQLLVTSRNKVYAYVMFDGKQLRLSGTFSHPCDSDGAITPANRKYTNNADR